MNYVTPDREADAGASHWIVTGTDPATRHHQARQYRPLFRHASQRAAEDEAFRLARLVPGRTFQVFASGIAFRNDPPPGEAA